jgi:hypothetical protein
MTEGSSYCFECKRPLVEIDNRGQRLRGCLTCNIWWSVSGGGTVKLSVETIVANGSAVNKAKPRQGNRGFKRAGCLGRRAEKESPTLKWNAA